MRAASCVLAMLAIAALAKVARAQPGELPDRDSVKPRETPGATIPVEMNAREVMSPEEAGTTQPAPAATATVPLEHPVDPDGYVCGPGDVFDLNFWGQQNFRLRIVVDLEGRTFIAKVGYVAATGKTLTAVRAEVKKKVRATYPGLQADLALVAPRSFQVHLVDNVKTPGSFTSSPLERVASVLARAGGLAPHGSKRQITIRRKKGLLVKVDLTLYELTGDTAHNPFVLDGDIISVPFAQDVVEVSGAVRRTGSYELIASKDLAELLVLAGGLHPSVARSLSLKIVRRNNQQQDTTLEVPFAAATSPNAELRDGDRIYVPGSVDVERSILVIGAVSGADPLDKATAARRLPFVEGDTVSSLIRRAGGLKTSGDMRRAYIERPTRTQVPQIIAVDLEALLVRRDLRADRKIAMGDIIVIPQMQYSVLVEGAVTRSGLYDYNPLFSIAQYIARAGGRTRTARDLDEVQLIDARGKYHSFHSGLRPSPGDTILVPERNFSRSEVVQIVIAGAGLVLSGVAITLAATR